MLKVAAHIALWAQLGVLLRIGLKKLFGAWLALALALRSIHPLSSALALQVVNTAVGGAGRPV